MTTSGVTSWSLTARDIITNALDENGILPIGEDPEAEEADKCLVRLNALLQKWRDMLHLQANGTVVIPADSASGLLTSDIADIISARVIVSANNERLLQRFERDEYLILPNKAASGSPTCFYVEDSNDDVSMYVWPVPSVETSLKVSYRRKPEMVTDLNQTVDFPQKYQEALYANLALRCTAIFQKQPMPELVARARELEIAMMDEERPASYMMGAW